MNLDALNLYLLGGLIAHKAVWEVMKRRQPPSPVTARARQSLKTTVTKAVKIAILLGIALQTLLPPVFPIDADPAMLRGAGFVLYTAGLAIAILGRVQLGDNWLDIEEAGKKREQGVVSEGVYRFIRHPIYVGDLLLLAGLELALESWLAAGVVVLAPMVLRQAIQEEKFLQQTLPGYLDYCRRTKRFVPFLA